MFSMIWRALFGRMRSCGRDQGKADARTVADETVSRLPRRTSAISAFLAVALLSPLGFHERREHAILIVGRPQPVGGGKKRGTGGRIDGVAAEKRKQRLGAIVVGAHGIDRRE